MLIERKLNWKLFFYLFLVISIKINKIIFEKSFNFYIINDYVIITEKKSKILFWDDWGHIWFFEKWIGFFTAIPIDMTMTRGYFEIFLVFPWLADSIRWKQQHVFLSWCCSIYVRVCMKILSFASVLDEKQLTDILYLLLLWQEIWHH